MTYSALFLENVDSKKGENGKNVLILVSNLRQGLRVSTISYITVRVKMNRYKSESSESYMMHIMRHTYCRHIMRNFVTFETDVGVVSVIYSCTRRKYFRLRNVV